MTSNLGSQYAFEENKELRNQQYEKEVQRYFKPEFINRIDDIVVFNALDESSLALITDKFISELQSRLENRDIQLVFTERAKNEIMEQGYDPVYGARPLKRYIQKEVETRLAYKMIEEALEENCVIQIDFVGNDYVIEKVG